MLADLLGGDWPSVRLEPGKWYEAIGFRGFAIDPNRWCRLSHSAGAFFRESSRGEPCEVTVDEFMAIITLAIANGHQWTEVDAQA